MALYSAPSPTRSELIVQPSYYTSSLYVDALRTDADTLASQFQARYSANSSQSPFSRFKELWVSQGWKWLHLKTLDDRTRESFLNVTCRIFLEKISNKEVPLVQAAALFALYTFYSTQLEDTAPRLWALKYIPISTTTHIHLYSLPNRLQDPALRSVLLSVLFILNRFAVDKVFLLLPEAKLLPHNPRNLPREIYIEPESITTLAGKKKGRPSRNDRTRKLKAEIDELEQWLNKTEPKKTSDDHSTLNEYVQRKSEFLHTINASSPHSLGRLAVTTANYRVLDRLKEVNALLGDTSDSPIDDTAGIQRIENAIQQLQTGQNTGILGLMEGSGLRHV